MKPLRKPPLSRWVLWCTEGPRSAQPGWVRAANLTLPHEGGSPRRRRASFREVTAPRREPQQHTQHSRACFVLLRGAPVLHILSWTGLQGSAFPPEGAFWRADISQREHLGGVSGGRICAAPRGRTSATTQPPGQQNDLQKNHFLWTKPPRPSCATFDHMVHIVLLLLALPALPLALP